MPYRVTPWTVPWPITAHAGSRNVRSFRLVGTIPGGQTGGDASHSGRGLQLVDVAVFMAATSLPVVSAASRSTAATWEYHRRAGADWFRGDTVRV
jgi:hypothetical protein